MKAIILAGGLGTRISEETVLKPKPMITVGGRPMLWHIMKIYSHYGINEFLICCGYKGYVIKEYFANYCLHSSDVTFDLANNEVKVHCRKSEPWKVTLIDTGEDTMTGGRIKRLQSYLQDQDAFCLTYGDGLADVNISELIGFHRSHGLQATLTSVLPPARFGAIEMKGGKVVDFKEKPASEAGMINGGFFVLSPRVLDLIEGDTTIWERAPLEALTRQRQLAAFPHHGFWQPMDTLRDRNLLESLWDSGQAPWKVWV